MSTDLDAGCSGRMVGLAILYPYSGRDARDDYEDALATISAGYRAGDGAQSRPQASRDGTISLHDPDKRAPGLAAALEATGKKALTVAFLADDPERIVRQMFMAYSATRLMAFGDEQRITRIRWKDEADEKQGFERLVYERGTDEYEVARAKCKTYASVYFALARYDEQGLPEIVFPDGFGYYRLRTTSLNSLRTLKSNLEGVRRLTGGRLRGIPFELTIGYREVARPNGRKTRIPVWQAVFRPPEGIVLGSRTLAKTAMQGLQQGRMLALPPATDELLAAEAADALQADFAEVAEPTEAEADLVARGGRCDAAYWRARWHAAAADSRYADDAERHRLVFALTRGRYASLETFLGDATEREAADLLAGLEQAKAVEQDDDLDPSDMGDQQGGGRGASRASLGPAGGGEDWGTDAEREDDADEPVPPSDDENLAGMARQAVRAFEQAFTREDGDKPPSPALVRAWRRFIEQELRRDPAPLLPYLVGKHAGELTAAEMRAVMSWGGGPDAQDQVAAILRLGTAAVPS